MPADTNLYTLATAEDEFAEQGLPEDNESENGQLIPRPSSRRPRMGHSTACVATALALSSGFLFAWGRTQQQHSTENGATMSVELAAGSSSPAAGSPIVAEKSGRCLDWGSVLVKSLECTDQAKKEQLWTYTTGHHLKIPDGRCLDEGGENVHIWKCSDRGDVERNQHWVYDLVSHQITHISNKNKCLQDSPFHSDMVSMQPCSTSNQNQKWLLRTPLALQSGSAGSAAATQPGTAMATAGTVSGQPEPKIVEIMHDGLCLNVVLADVNMRGCNASAVSQHWTFDSNTGLITASNGHCLAADRIDVPQACSENSIHQAWTFERNTGLFKTRFGTCLTVLEASVDGSKITMQACDGANRNQQWQLLPLMNLFTPNNGATNQTMQVLLTVMWIVLGLMCCIILPALYFWKKKQAILPNA
jgi:hypothetical protein